MYTPASISTMKHPKTVGPLSLGLVAMGLPPDNAEAAATSYQMLCKGRFRVEARASHMVLSFSKASSGTTNGVSLSNGQCAWRDRPLNSAEPTRINFSRTMGAIVARAHPGLVETIKWKAPNLTGKRSVRRENSTH